MFILNVAAGKILPIAELSWNDFLVNLDLNYFHSTPPGEVEKLHREHVLKCGKSSYMQPVTYYCNHDVYSFLENYTELFDQVVMYRFLEHVPKAKLLYFLYILSTSMKIGGTLDIIVPDYRQLAARIINEDVKAPDFEAQDIITTFELLNEPYCPHASVWTPDRAKYFFELEGRFEVTSIHQKWEFDGRDIYLRFTAERIK
jgi:predicted SAM-dependent methyltransferase